MLGNLRGGFILVGELVGLHTVLDGRLRVDDGHGKLLRLRYWILQLDPGIFHMYEMFRGELFGIVWSSDVLELRGRISIIGGVC